MVTALIGGFGAGLVCTAVSLLTALYFLVPPTETIQLQQPGDVVSFILFGLILLSEVVIGSGMRFAVERHREISRTLERRVGERTAEVVQRSREIDEKNRQINEANEQMMAMYERGGIMLGRLDLEGIVVDANRACVEDLGFTRAEIVGLPHWECAWWRIWPEVQDDIRRRVGRALAGQPSRGEVRFVTGYGDERVSDLSMMPIKDDAGHVAFVFVAALDVTERARQYRATFENAGVGIAHLSPEIRWTRVNDTFARIVGYPTNELVGKSVLDITHPDDREASFAVAECMRSGRSDSYSMEKRYVRKDGTPVWVEVTGNAVRRSDGAIDHWVVFIQDTSARKHAEEMLRREAGLLERRVEERTEELVRRSRELDERNRQLHAANEEFRVMYERSGILMGRLNPQGILVDASRACVEDLGFVREDVIGRPFWEGGWWRISPQVEDQIHERVERSLAGELSYGETAYVTGNGRERVSDLTVMPIKDEAGRVTLVVVTGLDITERARQYEATFENAAVGIAHASADLKWLRVNEALCRIIGYPGNELIGKPLMDFIHPDYREAVIADLERMRDGTIESYDAERRYLHREGRTVWVRASVSVVRKTDGSVDRFVGVIQDITASKEAEELLKRQADLLNQSQDAIFTWKIGGRGIVYWSRGAENLYGYAAAEVAGRATHELLQTRDPMLIEEIDEQVVQHGSWYGELTHTTRDGREIVVESRIVRVSYGGELFALETNRDVTERKRAEEQVRLLMREMNHRGKNMLGLVQAIARQTAASDPERFVDRFTDRIRALAASQDLLVRTSWTGVEVDDLVCAQLAHFSDLIGYRISPSGPNLRLNGAAAQAIGMALHELATNASKYGALSTQTGHVDITWLVDGDRFKINWTERNGPPVRPPSRRGFGTTVMEAMARQALGGEVQLEYDPPGLAWHLTCPLANALERQ